MTSKTKGDLKNLLDSFNEATTYWLSNLTPSTTTTPSKISNPIDELTKLVKLIKAHTTKVGIIFKPANLKKDPGVAYNTLEKFSETVVLLTGLIQLFDVAEVSRIFYDAIFEGVRNLIVSVNKLSGELIVIFDEDDEEEVSDDGRLVGVGKVWSNCDDLVTLLLEGAVGLLSSKIKQSILLLDDGFEEFKEWAEDPQDVDDDPFGISDDDEDEEEGETKEDKELVDNSEVSKFALKWVKKIQLIRLLISSFKKSIPKTTLGSLIDDINTIQTKLVNLIDKFIMNLMLDMTIDDEIIKNTKEIALQALKLCKLGVMIHASNTTKAKWYETWMTKFIIDSE
ncbi:hypothetical protein Cantr_01749 [Candida viswanathii]|uniref:Cyclin-D1-binding protein 1-like N-terminal domain-containing protein n=1 Tax=Candida viswanathii TaxID=5486 RepID=A0A367YLV5_9ASCO|nr:hypothetical protein Cantr_01749 [Candida viswanathii]